MKTKRELIDELVAGVRELCRKSVIDFYEVNQAEHLRWEFQSGGDLSDNFRAFVKNRAENYNDRHHASLVRLYASFREKFEKATK